jgi:SpoVK/Ycf46/Vps4 family AAA+-type ATPase
MNNHSLNNDLKWLENIILYQLGQAGDELKNRIENQGEIQPPALISGEYYSDFVANLNLNGLERGVFLIAAAVFLKPDIFQPIIKAIKDKHPDNARFGGVLIRNQTGFIPTGETAIYILTNGDLNERLSVMDVITPEHRLFNNEYLEFVSDNENFPITYQKIQLTRDTFDLLTAGVANKPDYSANFPANLVKVNLDWDDLVLSGDVLNQIKDLQYWLEFEEQLLSSESMRKKIKPGYKAVFYGPSGTGKTLVAGLLGKKHGLDVYRIDLSQLSSKYIGETEKNIANLFKQARNKSWILFFDEGESLFGKRTSSGGNNEKYANQQVGFLLQMIEDHPGVVILATNLKSSIDEAFLRRFQKMIYFESPDDTQRLELWQKALNLDLQIDSDIDLKKIAKDYLVVGGQIVNIVKQASLRALGNNNGVISQKILLQCITEELKKN